MLDLEGVFICTAGGGSKDLRRSCGHSIILPCHVTTEVGGHTCLVQASIVMEVAMLVAKGIPSVIS